MTAVRLSVVLACAAAMLSLRPERSRRASTERRTGRSAACPLPASVRGTTVEATLEASRARVGLQHHQELGLVRVHRRHGPVDRSSRSTPRATSTRRSTSSRASGPRSIRSRARTRTAAEPPRSRSMPSAGRRTTSASARARTRPTIASCCASSRPTSPRASRGAGCRAKALTPRSTGSRIPTTPGPSTLRRGTTYRLNFVSSGGRCATAELFAHEDDSPVRRLRCDAHTVVAPSASGTYSVLVRAPRGSRDRLTYRVRVGRAGADDTAPGIRLANDVRNRGHLQGNQLDAIDLYRFTIARPSELRLTLGTGKDFDLRLMTDTGHQIACECGSSGSKEIDRRVRPGPLLRGRARERRRRGQVRAAEAGARDHARTHARRRRAEREGRPRAGRDAGPRGLTARRRTRGAARSSASTRSSAGCSIRARARP